MGRPPGYFRRSYQAPARKQQAGMKPAPRPAGPLRILSHVRPRFSGRVRARCGRSRPRGSRIPDHEWSRGRAVPGWHAAKLVLTLLEGRFREAWFCCARSNDGASDRSFSPPCEGGAGGGDAGALAIENDSSRLARGSGAAVRRTVGSSSRATAHHRRGQETTGVVVLVRRRTANSSQPNDAAQMAWVTGTARSLPPLSDWLSAPWIPLAVNRAKSPPVLGDGTA